MVAEEAAVEEVAADVEEDGAEEEVEAVVETTANGVLAKALKCKLRHHNLRSHIMLVN